MSRSARSVLVFGLYMAVQGVVLLVAPNFLLGLSGLPPTSEVWARVVGWCLIVLGIYYTQSARAELKPFFRWTVAVRFTQPVVFLGLVFLAGASPLLLPFSLVEVASGLWTALELRAESRR